MGWCDTNPNPPIYIRPDVPYHGIYERFINLTLNWIRYKDWIQKYYYILKDGTLVPKFPRGAIPKKWF